MVPVATLLFYPFWWFVPCDSFLVTSNAVPALPGWVLIWVVLVCLFCGVFTTMFGFRWIADLHRISRKRLFLAMVCVYTPIMALHNYFVAPYVSRFIKLTSMVLQKLT